MRKAKDYFGEAKKKQIAMNEKASELESVEKENEGKLEKLSEMKEESDEEDDTQKKVIIFISFYCYLFSQDNNITCKTQCCI